MTNPPTDERRAAFEAWAQSKGYDIAKEYGLYRRDNTTAAFDGYKAALSHQGEVVKCIDYPDCSGDANSCPENEGYGCCKDGQ